ncbi:phage tail assembly chaperone [Nisaea acidiphila]|uniref:phage tail assembly chaperone n=1 Tax=Nisaea acidiphila TaxID=1862145 RepID=UPI004029DAE9
MPPALAEKPGLFPDLEEVARAFALLTRGRPLVATPAGAAEAPVPLTEIAAYCALFPVAEPEEFVSLLRAMDEAYLRARMERMPKTGKD